MVGRTRAANVAVSLVVFAGALHAAEAFVPSGGFARWRSLPLHPLAANKRGGLVQTPARLEGEGRTRTRNTPECKDLADRPPLANEDSAPRLRRGGSGTASQRRWLPRLAIVSGVLLSAGGVMAAEAGGIVAANDARRVFAVLLLCGGCGMWFVPIPKASETCLCHLRTWVPGILILTQP